MHPTNGWPWGRDRDGERMATELSLIADQRRAEAEAAVGEAGAASDRPPRRWRPRLRLAA